MASPLSCSSLSPPPSPVSSVSPTHYSSSLTARRHPSTYSPPIRRSDSNTVLFRPTTSNIFHFSKQRQIYASLEKLPSFAGTWRFIRRGGLAVDFLQDADIPSLLAITDLMGLPVGASLPGPPLLFKHTVRLPQNVIRSLNSSDLLSFYSASVLNPPIRSIRQIGSSSLLVIHFCSPPSVPSVVLGGATYPLTAYFAPPLRCANCQRFNHHATECRSTKTCVNCGRHQPHADCVLTPFCANCGGKHKASSLSCSHRLFFIQVAKIQSASTLSRREAWNLASRLWREGRTFQTSSSSSERISSFNSSKQLTSNDFLCRLPSPVVLDACTQTEVPKTPSLSLTNTVIWDCPSSVPEKDSKTTDTSDLSDCFPTTASQSCQTSFVSTSAFSVPPVARRSRRLKCKPETTFSQQITLSDLLQNPTSVKFTVPFLLAQLNLCSVAERSEIVPTLMTMYLNKETHSGSLKPEAPQYVVEGQFVRLVETKTTN